MRRVLVFGTGVALCMLAVQASAGEQPTNRALMQIVHRQAAQIERLEQRLDQVEMRQQNRSQADTGARRAQARPGVDARKSQAKSKRRRSPAKRAAAGKQPINVDWSSGAPTFSNADDQFSFTPIGRLQFDGSTTFGAGSARNASGSEFRRLWLGFDGKLPGPFGYRAQFNFADNDVKIEDAYISAKRKFSLGHAVVYLGNKKYDLGLNGATSSKWIWFIDRNTVTQAIKPQAGSHFTGLTGAFYGNSDWHASLAVSKGSINDETNGSGNLSVLSRTHVNPVATDNFVLHLGVFGFYDRFHDDNSFKSNYRLATHSNGLVRVGAAVARAPEHSTGYGFELAGMAGRFAANAEFGQRQIIFDEANDLDIAAYTGQIGYSLIGEAFGYSTKKGRWTRPDIAQPVTEGGPGALQLMARYQAVDYASDDNYAGDYGHGATVGLSWYLNDYLRILLNDTWWQTSNRIDRFVPDSSLGHHDGNTVAARAQVVF